MIFHSDQMKDLFLDVVKRAKCRYHFRIENFCIMGNHFHFIIIPGHKESLSSIMQWILGVFAIRFNRMNHLSGHVWGQRFFSRIIRTIGELQHISQYIDDNPVMAGLVQDSRDWPYGGLSHSLLGVGDIVDWP